MTTIIIQLAGIDLELTWTIKRLIKVLTYAILFKSRWLTKKRGQKIREDDIHDFKMHYLWPIF